MKIPLEYFAYFFIALFVGVVFAFGIASVTHQPLAVQVQVNQYQPIAPPAPAMPTIAPVKPNTEPFAPAPAPVVVTTAPLPTITPEPTKVGMCDVGTTDSATMPNCLVQEALGPMVSLLVGLVPIMIILAIIPMALSGFSYIFEMITGCDPRNRR